MKSGFGGTNRGAQNRESNADPTLSLPKDDSLANEQLKELLRLRGEVGKLRAHRKAVQNL